MDPTYSQTGAYHAQHSCFSELWFIWSWLFIFLCHHFLLIFLLALPPDYSLLPNHSAPITSDNSSTLTDWYGYCYFWDILFFSSIDMLDSSINQLMQLNNSFSTDHLSSFSSSSSNSSSSSQNSFFRQLSQEITKLRTIQTHLRTISPESFTSSQSHHRPPLSNDANDFAEPKGYSPLSSDDLQFESPTTNNLLSSSRTTSPSPFTPTKDDFQSVFEPSSPSSPSDDAVIKGTTDLSQVLREEMAATERSLIQRVIEDSKTVKEYPGLFILLFLPFSIFHPTNKLTLYSWIHRTPTFVVSTSMRSLWTEATAGAWMSSWNL